MKFLEKIKNSKEYFLFLGYIGVCYLSAIIFTFQRSNLGIVLLIIGALPFFKGYRLDKNQKLMLAFFLLVPLFQYFNLDEREIVFKELRKLYKFFPIFLTPLFLNTTEKIKGIFIVVTISILFNCGKIFLYLKSVNFKLAGYTYDGLANLGYTSHTMAGLSFVALGLVLYFWLKKKNILLVISSVVYLIIIYFVILGQRRGAYLAVLIPLIAILIININKKILLYGILIGILGLGIVSKTDYLKNNVYYKRFVSIKNVKESSPAIRLILWKASIELYKKNPIIGYSEEGIRQGYLNYIEKNEKELSKILPSLEGIKKIAYDRNPHNMYIRNIVDMGILGIYFTGIIFYFLYENLKFIFLMKKEKNIEYIMLLSSFGVILSFAVTSLTESVWETHNMREGLLFGIIIYFSLRRIIKNRCGEKK